MTRTVRSAATFAAAIVAAVAIACGGSDPAHPDQRPTPARTVSATEQQKQPAPAPQPSQAQAQAQQSAAPSAAAPDRAQRQTRRQGVAQAQPQEQQQALAEQQQVQQQDAQTTEYVADASQDAGWPALPLTASDRAQFCEDLKSAAALSELRANLWNAGQARAEQREIARNLIGIAQDTSAAMLDLYYRTNPPIDAVFLGLTEHFEDTAGVFREMVGQDDVTERSDWKLASLVRSAWAAVADYCGS